MTSNVPARKSSGRTPGLDEPVAVRESEGRPVGLLAKTRVALCHQRASEISRHDAFPSRVVCLEDASGIPALRRKGFGGHPLLRVL